MPKRIFIGILSMFTQKRYIASMQDQNAPNDLINQYNIDSYIKKSDRPTLFHFGMKPLTYH